MKNKPKVLIVHNYYQIPGGEDTVVANEKKLLESHGHKVILYTRSNSELKEMSFFQKCMLPFVTIYNIRTVIDIKRIIKKEKIDIVHVHNTLSLISPSVYYAANSCGVPVVQTIHNFRLLCPAATFYRDEHICEDCVKHGLRYAIKYKCYRKSRMQTLICVLNTKIHRITGIYGKINYICLTEFNKEKILQLKQIKQEKVFVKPNFVENTNEFIPNEKRANQYVFAGRLDKLKGIDILLEAWKQMGNIAPKLIICGNGPMENWCKKFITDNDINSELRGFVTNSEVRKIISNSKALILPTQLYEGFPMSIVEAYSVGTPVICPNFGNAGNLVEESVTGYKFKNKEDLVSCVYKVNQEDLCLKTFQKYLTKYTESINYNILSKIYWNLE